jgi:integrase
VKTGHFHFAENQTFLLCLDTSKSKGGRNDKNSSKPLLKYFSESKIDGITKQDIYRYLDWRKNTVNERIKRTVSGSTINREKSFLSEIFKKAIRWGYVNDNPVIGIEGFSENRRERYITDDEFKNILSKMEGYHKDLFLAVYHTAQRPGRIYSFQWKQIDFEGRSITFENTSRNKRVPNLLWINDTLLEILSRLKSDRRTLSPYVFYKPSLKPYSEFDALKIWQYACKKSNVEDTIPRDLRHKAISDMKRAGFNDAFVGNVAGHSDPRTTKRYTHFSVDETKVPLQALALRQFDGKKVAEK